MSEVITGLLKVTFALISNKVRAYCAEKLQDGDLTDQKFRGLIVRELDDIKSKLDAISRKDLCASMSFLQQGIQRLNRSFGESSESENPTELPNEKKQSQSTKKTCAGACSTDKKPAQQSVAVEDAFALANAIGKLKIESNELFELAKKSFEDNSRQRTVHSFKKDSRAEIVESVTMINLILADFISKFTKRRMAVFDWPMIDCGKRVVHPIHYDKESAPNMKKIKITPPWDIVVSEKDLFGTICTCALTTKGNLICVTDDRRGLEKLDKTTGKLQPYCLSPLQVNTEHPQPSGELIGIAIDDNDTVVVSFPLTYYVLYIYSADGQLKTTVKFRASEGLDAYGRLFYNYDTKIIVGHVMDLDDGKILIEYLSGQTARLQLSYVLYQTNFPE
ncbi:Hypothetical predicted protein, partial [Paramuricea clavata]